MVLNGDERGIHCYIITLYGVIFVIELLDNVLKYNGITFVTSRHSASTMYLILSAQIKEITLGSSFNQYDGSKKVFESNPWTMY